MPDGAVRQLSSEDRAAFDEFARRVRKEFPEARIWAFGSRVRGEGTWESDFDICVVIERYSPQARSRIGELAWEVGFDRDIVMTTVVFSSEDFDSGIASVSPLVANIRREGVAA